ncbi:ABC transporter permease [Ignavibacteria bacterium]|nr:ABC transporter permease [Bacteroidota bacterium]MCZ2131768.1 ABC transporter permease [Bacteroidota bacterium]
MKISEITESARFAYESLNSNKLRSLLTTLGVVIGIVFVILMGWLLSGLDAALEKTVNVIGTDMLYVDKWNWSGGKNWRDYESRKDINLAQATEFCRRVTTPEVAMPIAQKWGAKIQFKNQSISGISVQGVPAEYVLTPGGAVTDGRFFSKSEERFGADVAVVGYNVANTLFPDGDALGKEIKIRGHKFEIIGVVEKRGTFIMDFIDNQTFIPLQTFLGIYGTSGRSLSIAIKAGNEENLANARSEAIGLMRQIRNNQPGQPDDFSINESQMFREEINSLRMSTWGVGIGLVSLSFFVGIIGITNIMFVSVTERTKEIGIRKALGAKRGAIMLQFLMEAAALCFVGAVIAFAFCSTVIAVVVKVFFSDSDYLSSYVPPQLLLTASVVSIIVGILAGLMPALRAARMKPIDALRYE